VSTTLVPGAGGKMAKRSRFGSIIRMKGRDVQFVVEGFTRAGNASPVCALGGFGDNAQYVQLCV
jgi:hypothetical protein